MFVARAKPPIEIVGSIRTFSSTSAAISITTSTTFAADLDAATREGDFLVVTFTMGTAAAQSLNPSLPTLGTWTKQGTDYIPATTGWCQRTFTGFYLASMGSTLTVPINGTASTTGGTQVNIVTVRNVDTTTPVQSATQGTSLPSGATAATVTTFPTVTPNRDGCAVIWSEGGYIASVVANDATWSAPALELLDSGGPKCNASGSAAAFTAGYVQKAAAATGSVTCTTTNSRAYRNGCTLILNPA